MELSLSVPRTDGRALDELLASRRAEIAGSSPEDYAGLGEALRGDAEEQLDAANEALAIALATLRR